MKNLKETKTFENLKKLFTHECQKALLYLYCAKIAEFEGHEKMESLFKDSAEMSICNAHGNLDFIKNAADPITGLFMGGSVNNLQALIQAEKMNASEIYSAMAEQARADGFFDMANWFISLDKFTRSQIQKLQQQIKN